MDYETGTIHLFDKFRHANLRGKEFLFLKI